MTRRIVWTAAIAAALCASSVCASTAGVAHAQAPSTSAPPATAAPASPSSPTATPSASPSPPASRDLVVVTPTPQSSVVIVDGRPPVDAPSPGTHFLVEGYAGGTVVGGFGAYGGIRMGAGGKVPSLPWRFYLLGEVAYSTAATQGALPVTGEMFDEGRRWLDLAIGGRAIVPIVEPVRLFVDLLGGASYGSAYLARPAAPRIEPDGWSGLMILGAGVQVRINEDVSAGARLAMRLTGDPLDELRDVLGIDAAPPMTASGGVTWHW